MEVVDWQPWRAATGRDGVGSHGLRSGLWGSSKHLLPPQSASFCSSHSNNNRLRPQHRRTGPPASANFSRPLQGQRPSPHPISRMLFSASPFWSQSPSHSRICRQFQLDPMLYRTAERWVCFGGGQRPRRPRIWKTRQRRGTLSKSQKLLDSIRTVSDVKEELYGALDTFIAWEIDFPLIAVKKALTALKLEQNWKRVIQITKWMLGKGQGKTLGTYVLLIEALDMENRVEEATEVFNKSFKANMECTPRNLFLQVMRMYDRHDMPNELLEVFADMEELDVKLNDELVEIVSRTYEKIGIPDKAQKVRLKYPMAEFRYRTINGRRVKFRNLPRGGPKHRHFVKDSASKELSTQNRPEAHHFSKHDENPESSDGLNQISSSGSFSVEHSSFDDERSFGDEQSSLDDERSFGEEYINGSLRDEQIWERFAGNRDASFEESGKQSHNIMFEQSR